MSVYSRLTLPALALISLFMTACQPTTTALDGYSVDSDGAVVSIDDEAFYRTPKQLRGWSLREGDVPAPLLVLDDDTLRLCASEGQCSAPLMLHKVSTGTTQCRMTDQFRNPQGEDFAIGICTASEKVVSIDDPRSTATPRHMIGAGKPWFVIENRSGGLTVRARFKVMPLQ